MVRQARPAILPREHVYEISNQSEQSVNNYHPYRLLTLTYISSLHQGHCQTPFRFGLKNIYMKIKAVLKQLLCSTAYQKMARDFKRWTHTITAEHIENMWMQYEGNQNSQERAIVLKSHNNLDLVYKVRKVMG